MQDRSRLGGNSSQRSQDARRRRQQPQRAARLARERPHRGAAAGRRRQQPAALAGRLWDLLLYDKVVSEPNITLLLDTTVYAATVKDGRIDAGRALRQERASLPASAPRSSATARAIQPARPRGRAPTCARAARRAANSASPSRPRSPTTNARIQHPVHLAAVSQPDAVHGAEVGAQDHEGAARPPQDHESGSTATGGSSGAATDMIARQRAHPLRTARRS